MGAETLNKKIERYKQNIEETKQDIEEERQNIIEMLKYTKSEVNDLIDMLETSGTDELIDKYYQSIMLLIISMLSKQLVSATRIKSIKRNTEEITTMQKKIPIMQDFVEKHFNDDES